MEKRETKYQNRRKQAIKKEIKKYSITLGIGFGLGLIYSNLMFDYEPKNKPQTNEKTIEVQIPSKVGNEVTKPLKQEINECKLDSVSCKIKNTADKYGIDGYLAIAISKHETGKYTSAAFKELNNVGGMMYWNGNKMTLMSFENLDKGIESFVKNLKRNYYDMGLTSIEEIGNKYCPVGINDNGLNRHWIPNVTKLYYEMVK